jgi:hypothetical protein
MRPVKNRENSLQNRKRTELKNIFLDVFGNSTVHGLKKIVKNELIVLKIMWTLLLCGSLGYSVYSIVEIVSDYREYGVVSSTRIRFVNELDLPVITICNSNPFTTPYSVEVLSSVQNVSLIDGGSNSIDSNRLKYLNAKYYLAYYAKSSFNQSVLSRFGLTLNETVLSCVINFRDCSLENELVSFYDALYGNCFVFNANKNVSITYSGSLNSLQLELFSPDLTTNSSYLATDLGFSVFISDGQTALNTNYQDGITAPLGFTTNIALRKYSVSKQPYPYSECWQDLTKIDSYSSDCYKKTFELNGNSYSYEKCQGKLFFYFF